MSSQNSLSHMATWESSAVQCSKEGSKEGHDNGRVDSSREGIITIVRMYKEVFINGRTDVARYLHYILAYQYMSGRFYLTTDPVVNMQLIFRNPFINQSLAL